MDTNRENDAELRLPEAVGSMPGLVLLVFDASLRIVHLTGPGLVRLGLDPRLLVGRPVADTLPAAVYRRLQPVYRAALAGGAQRFVYTLLDGTATYHVEVFPLRDAAGAIVGGVVVAREVTAQPDPTRRGNAGPDLTVRGQPDLDRCPLDEPAPPTEGGQPWAAEKLWGLTAQGVTVAVNQLTRLLPPLTRVLTVASTPGRLVRLLPRLRTIGQP